MKWDVHLSAWVKTWRCGRRSIIMEFWNDGITLPNHFASAMADPTDAVCTLAHGFRCSCRRGRRSIMVMLKTWSVRSSRALCTFYVEEMCVCYGTCFYVNCPPVHDILTMDIRCSWRNRSIHFPRLPLTLRMYCPIFPFPHTPPANRRPPPRASAASHSFRTHNGEHEKSTPHGLYVGLET